MSDEAVLQTLIPAVHGHTNPPEIDIQRGKMALSASHGQQIQRLIIEELQQKESFGAWSSIGRRSSIPLVE